MPGFEPFLLCDFHVHTRWSDGSLSVREAVDLYGRNGRFDAIAITDHVVADPIPADGGVGARPGSASRLTRLTHPAYVTEIAAEAERAMALYQMLVIPGAEITPRSRWGLKSAPIVALGLDTWVEADQPAEALLAEVRRRGAYCIAHPARATAADRIGASTCYLWSHPRRLRSLSDVWEAVRLDGRLSVAGETRQPSLDSTGRSAAGAALWKTLVRSDKNWGAISRALTADVDVAVTLYRMPASQPSMEAASVGGR